MIDDRLNLESWDPNLARALAAPITRRKFSQGLIAFAVAIAASVGLGVPVQAMIVQCDLFTGLDCSPGTSCVIGVSPSGDVICECCSDNADAQACRQSGFSGAYPVLICCDDNSQMCEYQCC